MKIVFDNEDFDGQFLRALSYAAYGGADIGECFETASNIKEGDRDLKWRVRSPAGRASNLSTNGSPTVRPPSLASTSPRIIAGGGSDVCCSGRPFDEVRHWA